ncbi:hypothetical protein NPIL_512291 [Nephila pilipes]|uniref:Uncharacterized protein n=1 Tax=Nephila pilipes TaxID=299642 RepID=A0A8X6QUX1_NEPPI|nr:hypothetical protein NPIL_512291 [Nephila pilipes]
MKDEERFGYVVFIQLPTSRPHRVCILFVKFRQQLNHLEPSEILSITSYRDSTLSQLGQLLPDYLTMCLIFNDSYTWNWQSFKMMICKKLLKRGMEPFCMTYGWKTQIIPASRVAWEVHGHQIVPQFIKQSQTLLDSIYGDK